METSAEPHVQSDEAMIALAQNTGASTIGSTAVCPISVRAHVQVGKMAT
jgi:hypothetical protein